MSDDTGLYDPSTHCAYDAPMNKYSAALYWSIVTITSVGYGDITPQNPSEVSMSVWWWCPIETPTDDRSRRGGGASVVA